MDKQLFTVNSDLISENGFYMLLNLLSYLESNDRLKDYKTVLEMMTSISYKRHCFIEINEALVMASKFVQVNIIERDKPQIYNPHEEREEKAKDSYEKLRTRIADIEYKKS